MSDKVADKLSAPAAPPHHASERDALAADAERLAPRLARSDTASTLAPLLRLVSQARMLGAEGFGVLRQLAARLRADDAFDDLYLLTTEMQAGGLDDAEIRRWRVQALIELRVYETALDLARAEIKSGPKTPEGREGYSALGRIYKQMYIDAVTSAASRPEPQVLALYLERSLAAYLTVWESERTPVTAYFGVNAVAIAMRAVKDGATNDKATQALKKRMQVLAQEVLSTAAMSSDPWSVATRGEALVALGRYDEAAAAYAAYSVSPVVTLFQLSSSLRQLEEVWLLKGDDEAAGAPVRLLKVAILSKIGGAATAQASSENAHVSISPQEAALIRADIAAAKSWQPVLSNDAPLALQVIHNGLDRARAVCRIHANINGRDTPIASGFAIEGRLLNDAWGADPVILTNNHVISTHPVSGARRAEDCEAVFVSQETGEQRRVAFEAVLWESDVDGHDVTILRPKGALPAGAHPLRALSGHPLPPTALNDDGIGRVYVIGFPAGGDLSFSFADNIFLDHEAAPNADVSNDASGHHASNIAPDPVRLHYRSGTRGGSSGSPVFDASDFALLGVHHAGSTAMEKLNGRGGRYTANEGVWIESVRAAIADSEAAATDSESGILGALRRWRSHTPPQAAAAAPILAEPVASGPPPQPAIARIHPGAEGDASAGYSPVAKQILKTGKATAEEIKASRNESVIGLDDRTRIFETAMSPWRMLCAIRCWWGTRLGVGTGALVAPNMILTAGHVVFPRDKRTLPDRIEIIPALNGAQQPYGPADVARVSVHPDWQTKLDLAHDVAAIHLSKPIGLTLGWFALATRPADDLRASWAHVTGYPGEKSEPTFDEAGHPAAPVQASQLWHHSAPILNVQNNRIFYAADTTPGQSGAPIYIVDPAVSPTPVIVGVHAYGKISSPTAVGPSNSGAWIDPALYEVIATWLDASAKLMAPQAVETPAS